MASKSLSALKSRKEEIMDHLEDLVGKEEAIRISHLASESAPPPSDMRQPTGAGGKQWNTNIVDRHRGNNPAMAAAAVAGGGVAPSQVIPGNSSGYYSMWTSRSLVTMPNSNGLPLTKRDLERDPDNNDDIIPFTDEQSVSRFGPISRRQTSLLHNAKPSQSQAIISDEPTPTAVVRHSKQMARQVPSVLYHNGTCTTLQPVAMPNGEIGFVAVPPPATECAGPPPLLDPTLQHIQNNSAMRQFSPMATAAPSQHQHLYAESERMKQVSH